MDKTEQPRQFVLKLGLFSCFLALAANPWVLASWSSNGTIRSAGVRALIVAAEVVLFAAGVLLLRARHHRGLLDAMERMTPRGYAMASGTLFLLFLLAATEIFACLLFWKLMPDELRRRAFIAATGRIPGSAAPLTPKIRPYLWSNYAPNPNSPEANRYGWRYGGGPKTNRLRILCLGGSTTWSDTASAAEKSYPAQLEAYLRDKGYSVDVVNGGAPYYTSAELIGTFAFRGIHEKPDILLLHTGGNDIEPFLSPRQYQADYGHWRTARWLEAQGLNRDAVYSVVWRFPSWTTRLLSLLYLKPSGRLRLMVGNQLTQWADSVTATNDISALEATGLETNFRTLLGLARAHRIDAVTILFNLQTDKLHIKVPSLAEAPEVYEQARKRVQFGLNKSNETMQRISEEFGVPTIPFQQFQPSKASHWVDHCHLTDDGEMEKAIFIGERLLGLLEKKAPRTR